MCVGGVKVGNQGDAIGMIFTLYRSENGFIGRINVFGKSSWKWESETQLMKCECL